VTAATPEPVDEQSAASAAPAPDDRPQNAGGGTFAGYLSDMHHGDAADEGAVEDVAVGDGAVPATDVEARPSLARRWAAAGLTVLVVAVVGAPLGLLWAKVAPGVPIVKTEDGAVFAHPSPEEFIAADGIFTIIMFGLGVAASLVSWFGFRRYRGPLTMLALAVGSVGASVLAWQVGRRIDLGAYRDSVAAARPGDLLTRPPDLRAGGFTRLFDVVPFVRGDLLIATFGAVIVYTLLAGWSRTASLRPEPPPVPYPPSPYPAAASLPAVPLADPPADAAPADSLAAPVDSRDDHPRPAS